MAINEKRETFASGAAPGSPSRDKRRPEPWKRWCKSRKSEKNAKVLKMAINEKRETFASGRAPGSPRHKKRRPESWKRWCKSRKSQKSIKVIKMENVKFVKLSLPEGPTTKGPSQEVMVLWCKMKEINIKALKS